MKCAQRDRLSAVFKRAVTEWHKAQDKMRNRIKHRRPLLTEKDVKKIEEIQKRLNKAHEQFRAHVDGHRCWQTTTRAGRKLSS